MFVYTTNLSKHNSIKHVYSLLLILVYMPTVAGWGVFSGATTCKVNKKFMDLTELHDTSKSFLLNDALTIGVEIHHIYYDREI